MHVDQHFKFVLCDRCCRNMIEAFGQRMELWFSPPNPHSSTGTGSRSGSGSGTGSLSGMLAQLRGSQPAAQHTSSHLMLQRQRWQQQRRQQEEQEPHDA